MEKLLTIAVPCYNVTWCLDKCLSSFLDEAALDKLEIIIVNDGSTDDTHKIALWYVDKYPCVFKLINKQNGGHGSAINAAIKQATGKYFKVVDADDWVENLSTFLETLYVTEADAIITNFHTVDMVTGRRQEYRTRDIMLNKVYTLDEFTEFSGDIYPCTVFHGLTYRTKIYKDSGTVLSEGIFYDDQEYATFPFVKALTVLPLDMFLYEYLVGNVNQSVSDQNQVRRLDHVEQVVRRIFQCYIDNSAVSKGARRYIARKATDMLLSYYVIAMIKNPDKRGGRLNAERVCRDMRELAPDLVAETDSKYKLAIAMNRLGFNSRMLEQMKRQLPYALFRAIFKRNSIKR